MTTVDLHRLGLSGRRSRVDLPACDGVWGYTPTLDAWPALSMRCTSTLMVLSRSVCNHLPKVRAYAGTISLEPSPNSLPFIVLHNHMYPETTDS
uniref:Uncharacterized protein n=1 Tax=Oryza meridionalis TaxID=40149 RepID=A0A0E0C7W7_9ORYZ